MQYATSGKGVVVTQFHYHMPRSHCWKSGTWLLLIGRSGSTRVRMVAADHHYGVTVIGLFSANRMTHIGGSNLIGYCAFAWSNTRDSWLHTLGPIKIGSFRFDFHWSTWDCFAHNRASSEFFYFHRWICFENFVSTGMEFELRPVNSCVQGVSICFWMLLILRGLMEIARVLFHFQFLQLTILNFQEMKPVFIFNFVNCSQLLFLCFR